MGVLLMNKRLQTLLASCLVAVTLNASADEIAKAKNIAVNPQVSCHWMVGEDTGMDSLILWGTGKIVDDIDTKKRLWKDVFDYDLGMWAPGGPENCPDKGFLKITPEKIILLKFYGVSGRHEWVAEE